MTSEQEAMRSAYVQSDADASGNHVRTSTDFVGGTQIAQEYVHEDIQDFFAAAFDVFTRAQVLLSIHTHTRVHGHHSHHPNL